MRAIIMAAGRGTRISKNIADIPKCLVEVGDTKLIKHTIQTLRNTGVNNIAITVGYKHTQITDELANDSIDFVYNPFFNVTNSIASLWFARHLIKEDEDLILANGDVFYNEELIKMLQEDEREVVMLSDKRRVADGDYFFNTNENNEITAYGKDLELENRTCEYVGIARIKSSFVKTFMDKLEEMINEQKNSVWWENVLYELSETYPIYSKDVGDIFWAEVDFIEDYHRILDYIKNNQ